MLYFCFILFLQTQCNSLIDNGNILSLIEVEDKMAMFTVSPDRTCLNLLTIQPDLRTIKKLIHCDKRPIISAVPLDFNGDGKLDLLVVIQENEEYEYVILWDMKDSPQKIGMFPVEPFIISEEYYPSFLTISANKTSVLYKIGKGGDFSPHPGFGPSNWAKVHCNHQISLSFPSTIFFFTTEDGYEIWSSNHDHITSYKPPPPGVRLGESSFYELDGTHVHILPVCMKDDCSHWRIYARIDDDWKVMLNCFIPLASLSRVRSSDLDFDGFDDLILPPLIDGGGYLLRKTHPCPDCITTSTGHHFFLKTFPIKNLSVIAPFYLSTSSAFLLVQNKSNPHIMISSHVENHDGAFFYISVCLRDNPLPATPIRLFHRTFDSAQSSTSNTLLPSFSHQSLYLPYVMFGLSLNPKFVERVGVAHIFDTEVQLQTWKGLIPNSHAFIIINPNKKWDLKIFISYGKSLFYTGVSLLLLFIILMLLSIFLKWREIIEDRREKYSEERRNLMSIGAW